jgi:hypothetical protein
MEPKLAPNAQLIIHVLLELLILQDVILDTLLFQEAGLALFALKDIIVTIHTILIP